LGHMICFGVSVLCFELGGKRMNWTREVVAIRIPCREDA
jgi:hypothetical protein